MKANSDDGVAHKLQNFAHHPMCKPLIDIFQPIFNKLGIFSTRNVPGFGEARVSTEAQDDALAARLWERSAEVVGL